MSVVCLGLNHRSAPVGLLERAAIPAEHLQKALTSLLQREHVLEAVVISTCNRVEVYAHVTRFHAGLADLRNFFAEWGGLAPEDFLDLAYDFHDGAAAGHLFAVASGLDSMVVGERQIHLQVRQAFRDAQDHGAVGRMLQRLFRQALHVGKRTRSETRISAGASSMVDVGLEAAGQVLGDLAARTVLVIGAGKMGGMAASRVAGVAGRLLVTNRTSHKAERLAGRVAGEAVPFGEVASALGSADLVIASTGAPTPVIEEAQVAAAMDARGGSRLVLLDLAVPRAVDPACAILEGVTVLDVDAVRELVDTGSTGAEVTQARAIVAEEAKRFATWTQAVRVDPTIAALRARAEAVRQGELSRLGAKLGSLDQRQVAALDALTKGIVNTLLHGPTVRLKALADGQSGDLHAAALRELFDLPDEIAGD